MAGIIDRLLEAMLQGCWLLKTGPASILVVLESLKCVDLEVFL